MEDCFSICSASAWVAHNWNRCSKAEHLASISRRQASKGSLRLNRYSTAIALPATVARVPSGHRERCNTFSARIWYSQREITMNVRHPKDSAPSGIAEARKKNVARNVNTARPTTLATGWLPVAMISSSADAVPRAAKDMHVRRSLKQSNGVSCETRNNMNSDGAMKPTGGCKIRSRSVASAEAKAKRNVPAIRPGTGAISRQKRSSSETFSALNSDTARYL